MAPDLGVSASVARSAAGDPAAPLPPSAAAAAWLPPCGSAASRPAHGSPGAPQPPPMGAESAPAAVPPLSGGQARRVAAFFGVGPVHTAPTGNDAANRHAPRGGSWEWGQARVVFLTCLAEPSVASMRDEGLGRRPAATPSGPNLFAEGGAVPRTASAAASPLRGRRASPASPAGSDERGGVVTLRWPMAEEMSRRDRLAAAVGESGGRGTVPKIRGQTLRLKASRAWVKARICPRSGEAVRNLTASPDVSRSTRACSAGIEGGVCGGRAAVAV